MSKPLVYLAAPYAIPDPPENTNKVIQIANLLVEDGVVWPLVPHLSLLWHLVTPRSVDFWYEYDLVLLARCDALMRLPGKSTGADAELVFAREHGMPIFHEVPEVYRWARLWKESK